MKKLLIICGPTATGKTDLAFHLTQVIPGELVSADSRQVYKELSFLTGKDIPRDFQRYQSELYFHGHPVEYYGNGSRIWLTDIFSFQESANIADYKRLATMVLGDIWQRQRLPVIVGGTGLYIKAIVSDIETISIPPNQTLRNNLDHAPIEKLQEELQRVDNAKWHQMNQSDRKNPRRLVRAIEVALWNNKKRVLKDSVTPERDILWIGLTATVSFLEERIRERIKKRWNEGVVDEVRDVISDDIRMQNYLTTALGFENIMEYLQGNESQESVWEKWFIAERKYVKRQLVWFKKQPQIQWFSIEDFTSTRAIVDLVKAWYTKS